MRRHIATWGILILMLMGCSAFGQESSAPPTAERIARLIRELERESALPSAAWGGAVPEESLHALQAVQEGAERAASEAAVQALIKMGPAAAPQLTAELRTTSGRKAEAIAQILGEVGGREAVYHLLRVADDPNQVLRARIAAALAAAKQGDREEWPLLLAGLWLSGEWLQLSEALARSKLVLNRLDAARLEWYRAGQQRTFNEALGAMRRLSSNSRTGGGQPGDVWGTIVAWNSWWARGNPFRVVEVLADDPWQNRYWCQRTLGILSEYGPIVGEMRRRFIEDRIREFEANPPSSLGEVVTALAPMSYGVEGPLPESKEATRFSLLGFVRSGTLIQDYGYDRKSGAWVVLDKAYVGVDWGVLGGSSKER